MPAAVSKAEKIVTALVTLKKYTEIQSRRSEVR